MKNNRIGMALLPVATAVCWLGAGAVDAAEFDRTVPADPRGTVEISNVSGRVTVTGWDRSEVSVRGELGDDVERVDVNTSGGRTVVKVVLPGRGASDSDAELDVRVPKYSEVQATTVSADLITSELLGPQRLKTVSGELRAGVPGADFEAKTVSGDIRLQGDGKPADIRVSTVSGDITLTRGAGELEASSISGDLRLEVDPASAVRMHSTSGDITFRGNLTETATLEAETVSGEVTLRARSQAGYEYEATSFSGDIDNCFGRRSEFTSRHGPGVRLAGRTGEGKARLRAKSMSGDIEICDK